MLPTASTDNLAVQQEPIVLFKDHQQWSDGSSYDIVYNGTTTIIGARTETWCTISTPFSKTLSNGPRSQKALHLQRSPDWPKASLLLDIFSSRIRVVVLQVVNEHQKTDGKKKSNQLVTATCTCVHGKSRKGRLFF